MYSSIAPETFEKIQNTRSMARLFDLRSYERRSLAESNRNDAGCTKVAFASKASAFERIRQINALPVSIRNKTMRNAYRCPACESWHLTSTAAYSRKGVAND